jgi:hypothetical protein
LRSPTAADDGDHPAQQQPNHWRQVPLLLQKYSCTSGATFTIADAGSLTTIQRVLVVLRPYSYNQASMVQNNGGPIFRKSAPVENLVSLNSSVFNNNADGEINIDNSTLGLIAPAYLRMP